MKFKGGFIVLVLIFFVAFSSQRVDAALGLSPALIETDFSPEMKFLVDFKVLGVSPDQKVKIYSTGDLSEYVRFDKTDLIGPESFTAYVDLPKNPPKFGKNLLYIRAQEVKDDSSGIGTKIEVGALIVVKVPYPGKYAEIKTFSANNVNYGEPVNFIIEVENLGEENITANASANLYSEGRLIDRVDFGTKIFLNNSRGSFEKSVSTPYEPGIYNATATISYGRLASYNTTFKIGELFVDIVNSSSTFTRGKIHPFNIYIESKWNNDLSNVYAIVNVSRDKIPVTSFKTSSISLKKWEKSTLTGFFDAENLENGKYDANITLFYEGSVSTKMVPVVISNPPLNKTVVTIISAAIILFLILLIVVVYLIFKLRDGKQTPKRRKK